MDPRGARRREARLPTTTCGDRLFPGPIVPGVFAAETGGGAPPVLLWVAPGSDRVELRGRFDGIDVRAVYAVRCARFPLPGTACSPSEPSPLRLDRDAEPAAAGRCSTGEPGLCFVLLLARRRRMRAR